MGTQVCQPLIPCPVCPFMSQHLPKAAPSGAPHSITPGTLTVTEPQAAHLFSVNPFHSSANQEGTWQAWEARGDL